MRAHIAGEFETRTIGTRFIFISTTQFKAKQVTGDGSVKNATMVAVHILWLVFSFMWFHKPRI
jgi:hypothetical protein